MTAQRQGPKKSALGSDQLASVRRESQRLRRQIWRMTYKAVLLVAMGLSIFAVGLAIVAPELQTLFDSLPLRANAFSETVLALATLSRRFWLLTAMGLLALGHLPWIMRRKTEAWLRRSILFGPTEREIDDAEWCRIVALALSSGKSLAQAFQTAAEHASPGEAAARGFRWADQLNAGATWAEIAVGDLGLPADWLPFVGPHAPDTKPHAAWNQLAQMNAGCAGMRHLLLHAAVWPATGVLLGLLMVVWGRAIYEPIMAYFRSWA